MNDDQRAKLIGELGRIFDQAARCCSHCGQAAIMIEQELRKSGYVISLRKQRKTA